jgi:hypothetical protein
MSEAGVAQGDRDVALIDGIETVLARVTVAGYYRLYGKVGGLAVDARPSALAEIGSRWDLAVIYCPDVLGRQTRRRPLSERVRWARSRSEDSRAIVLDLDAFYDDRTTDFYALRRRLATASGPELAEVVRGMVRSVAEAIVADHCPPGADPNDGDLDHLLAAMASVLPTTPTRQQLIAGPRDPAPCPGQRRGHPLEDLPGRIARPALASGRRGLHPAAGADPARQPPLPLPGRRAGLSCRRADDQSPAAAGP